MSDSEDLEQPSKRPRKSAGYMGPSHSHQEVDVYNMPPGHSYECAHCSRPLAKTSEGGHGLNNLPLTATRADLQNMGLPIWLKYDQVWPGTYCCCISLCNDCLDVVFGDCNAQIKHLQDEEQQEPEEETPAGSSLEYYKAPSGNKDFPTKQHVALVRTVLVQMREAIFSMQCSRGQ